jgi:hypothetical protein
MLKIGFTGISWWNSFSSKIFIFKDFTLQTSSKGSFLGNRCNSSIRLWSRSILLFLACGLVTTFSWYQKVFFSIGFHIGSCGVFDLVLMHHNFSGWFPVGRTFFDSLFLVMTSNSFCSPLWKVISSSRSFLGCSNHFALLTWPTLTLSCKTCSIIFFIFLVNIVGIL